MAVPSPCAIPPNITRSAESNLENKLGAIDSNAPLVYGPQQGNDTGAHDGPRKRLRLAQGGELAHTGTLDTWMDENIFQILGIADTEALFEVDPTVR